MRFNYKITLIVICFLAIKTVAIAQTHLDSQKEYKLSVLGSNFIKFDANEMMDMVDRLKIHYLSLKEKHLPFDSTDEEIDTFKKKLESKGITIESVGLFYLNKEEEVDRVFEYAQRVGVNMIVGTPQYELLPYIEKKAIAYNIKFAIHIHGGDIPLYPCVKDVVEHIENLDSRIGVSFDIGHELRAGYNPAESLVKYQKYILDVHLKDVTAADKSGRTCNIGLGVLDFESFINALHHIGFKGCCSLELETARKDPLPGLAESKGYFSALEDYYTKKNQCFNQ